MFRDRTDAGRQLAEVLDDHDVTADVILAIPRGGLPVGRAVADELGVPLDVVVARKIGAPNNPELAVGAVASDGSVWLNDAVVGDLGVDDEHLERERERERRNAEEKERRYRRGSPPDLAGKTVLVVDDGVATGATITACVRLVKDRGAARVIVAVPVSSPTAAERLRAEADEVIAVETPPHFSAVGQFYEDFRQVSDEEALTYLD